jgi:hypothetical protein
VYVYVYINSVYGDADYLFQIAGLGRDRPFNQPVAWVTIPSSVLSDYPKAMYWIESKKQVLVLTATDALYWINPVGAYGIAIPIHSLIDPHHSFMMTFLSLITPACLCWMIVEGQQPQPSSYIKLVAQLPIGYSTLSTGVDGKLYLA